MVKQSAHRAALTFDSSVLSQASAEAKLQYHETGASELRMRVRVYLPAFAGAKLYCPLTEATRCGELPRQRIPKSDVLSHATSKLLLRISKLTERRKTHTTVIPQDVL